MHSSFVVLEDDDVALIDLVSNSRLNRSDSQLSQYRVETYDAQGRPLATQANLLLSLSLSQPSNVILRFLLTSK